MACSTVNYRMTSEIVVRYITLNHYAGEIIHLAYCRIKCVPLIDQNLKPEYCKCHPEDIRSENSSRNTYKKYRKCADKDMEHEGV